MKLRALPCDLRALDREHIDLALACIHSDIRPFQGLVGQLSYRLAGRFEQLVLAGLVTGALGETFLFGGSRKLPVSRVLLIGLGDAAKADETTWREGTRALGEQARALLAKQVLIELPGRSTEQREIARALEDLLTTWEPLAFDEIVIVDRDDKTVNEQLALRRRW